jgi:ADP-heptose:LPS heptosyltransferase
LKRCDGRLAPFKFDLAVDLRKHGDTRKLLKYSGALLTAGFDFRGEFAWLDIALNWEGDNQLARKRQHVSNDLVNLVNSIAAAGEQHRTAFKRPPDWSKRQVPIISRLTGLGLYRRRIVCVHPAAGNEMRQWPERHFAGIINLLLDTEDIDIAVIGGPDESDTANRVLDMVNEKDRVYMLAGKFKLNELPLFLDSCALFIGNNSGPKHIAAHLGVPTIGVHSGVVDAREWGPIGDAAVAIRRDMICAPCYLAKREDCHRQLACVEGLAPSHLLPMCRKMLALGRGIVITA